MNGVIKGFTLFEILIAIGLLAIIASIVFISFPGFSGKQILDDTAAEIASILREAQSRSAGQENGQVWGVYFKNPSSESSIFSLFSGPVVPPPQSNVAEQYPLADRIKFISPGQGGEDSVIFNSITGLPTASKTIIISLKDDESNTRTVTVNANGTITY